MTARHGTSRLAETVLAASLALVAAATVTLRLLADPASALSRWLDRANGDAVTLPGGAS